MAIFAGMAWGATAAAAAGAAAAGAGAAVVWARLTAVVNTAPRAEAKAALRFMRCVLLLRGSFNQIIRPKDALSQPSGPCPACAPCIHSDDAPEDAVTAYLDHPVTEGARGLPEHLRL